MTTPGTPLHAPTLPLWTREDVSRNCQVSVRTVAAWVADRRIPAIKLGRAVRFRPDAVMRALQKFEIREAAR